MNLEIKAHRSAVGLEVVKAGHFLKEEVRIQKPLFHHEFLGMFSSSCP
jgi:hypothetical protein